MFKHRRRVIGLEIAADSLRGVVLDPPEHPGEPIVVKGYGFVSREGERELKTSLRKLFMKLPPAGRDCAVSIWPVDSMVRLVSAPPNSAALLTHRVRTNSHELIGRDLGNFEVSCAPVDETAPPDAEKVPYVICGSPKPEIQNLATVLESLGRNLYLLQLTPVAVANAFCDAQRDQIKEGPFLVVAFGRTRTSIIGGFSGNVALFRTIEWGMKMLEENMLQAGVIASPADLLNLKKEDVDAVSALELQLDDLSDELRRCADFLEGRFGYGMPSKVFVSGPLSNGHMVIGTLSLKLGVTCTQWNPLRHCAAAKGALKNELLEDLSLLPGAAGAGLQMLL